MCINIVTYGLEEELLEQIKESSSSYNSRVKVGTSVEELSRLTKDDFYQSVLVVDIDAVMSVNELADSEKEEDQLTERRLYDLSSELRDKWDVPSIYISTAPSPDNRLRWMSFGARAFVLKPCYAEEILRKCILVTKQRVGFEYHDNNFKVDLLKRNLYYHEQKMKTTPVVYSMLLFFIMNAGRVVTREEIIKEIYDGYSNLRNVDGLIRDIRKMTGKDVIKTVRGVGYIYNP